MRDTEAAEAMAQASSAVKCSWNGLRQGQWPFKVKGACRDPGGDEFLNSFISYWQYDTTCETTDKDPLFLKALQKDGVYEKAIPVPNSLQCEGMYAIGKPCPYSHGPPVGMHSLLAEEQHYNPSSIRWGKTISLGLFRSYFSQVQSPVVTAHSLSTASFGKTGKSNKPTKAGFKC